MTPEEIFARVVTHVITQGKPAKEADGACLYRTNDNLKCAVGCLITDEDYRQTMEGKSVYELECYDLLPPALIPHGDLLGALQSAHDEADVDDFINDFVGVARAVGIDYGIDPAVIEAALNTGA